MMLGSSWDDFDLRELVTSTTVILAPGACGRGVRKRSQVPTLASVASVAPCSLRSLRSLIIPGGSILCTGATLLAIFPVKDLTIFMISQEGGRKEARGSPRRPKEGQGTPKEAKRTPRGARKEVQGAKKMPKGRQRETQRGARGANRDKHYILYKLTPDQPQSGRYVN